MAQKIIKAGKWYLFYEVSSTLAMMGVTFFGFDIPGYF